MISSSVGPQEKKTSVLKIYNFPSSSRILQGGREVGSGVMVRVGVGSKGEVGVVVGIAACVNVVVEVITG